MVRLATIKIMVLPIGIATGTFIRAEKNGVMVETKNLYCSFSYTSSSTTAGVVSLLLETMIFIKNRGKKYKFVKLSKVSPLLFCQIQLRQPSSWIC